MSVTNLTSCIAHSYLHITLHNLLQKMYFGYPLLDSQVIVEGVFSNYAKWNC